MRHDSKRECETNRNSKCRTAAPPQGGRTKVCTSNGTSPSPRPSLQDARTQRAPHALAGHIQGVIMAASTVREVGNHCERVTGGAKGSDAPVRAGMAYLLMYFHNATLHRGENSQIKSSTPCAWGAEPSRVMGGREAAFPFYPLVQRRARDLETRLPFDDVCRLLA